MVAPLSLEFRLPSTGFAFRIEHRKWNRGRNSLHQLGQPVAPSILFPVFNPEGEPGIISNYENNNEMTHRSKAEMKYVNVRGEEMAKI